MSTLIAASIAGLITYLIGARVGYIKGYEDGYDNAALDFYLAEKSRRYEDAA